MQLPELDNIMIEKYSKQNAAFSPERPCSLIRRSVILLIKPSSKLGRAILNTLYYRAETVTVAPPVLFRIA